MSDFYILEGKKVVAVDMTTWSRWFQTADRHVADSEKDGIRVSTVFLGLDHGCGDGEPLIFETMIFGGEHDQWQKRCSTYDEAEKMHNEACAMAFGSVH